MKNRILIIALAALTFTAMTSCSASTENSKLDAVLENIHNRKSVRQFTAEPVSDADIESMLRAAMAAPTAVNYQPWRFVVITERADLDAMAEVLPYAKMLKQAPLAVAVCGETTWFDGNEDPYWQQDCSAAVQNLLLAAEALGLGAVWTGVYPDPQRSADLSRFLGLPSTVQPLCAIPIGHHDGTTQPKDKWKPENIHYGKW
jgi:nitroreductase